MVVLTDKIVEVMNGEIIQLCHNGSQTNGKNKTLLLALLTLFQKFLNSKDTEKTVFENIVQRGENIDSQHSLLFPQCLQLPANTNFTFLVEFDL